MINGCDKAQVEFDELEDGSILAMTIAWDDALTYTWHTAVRQLQATLHQVSPCFLIEQF